MVHNIFESIDLGPKFLHTWIYISQWFLPPYPPMQAILGIIPWYVWICISQRWFICISQWWFMTFAIVFSKLVLKKMTLFFLTFLTNMFKLKSSFNKDFMSSTNSFPQLVLYNRSTTFGFFFNQILLIAIHWVPGFISLLLGSILVHIWICII